MADIFLGETYDANKEIKGWQTSDFNDSEWENVVVDEKVLVSLVPQTNQPIRAIETLKAKSVSRTNK